MTPPDQTPITRVKCQHLNRKLLFGARSLGPDGDSVLWLVSKRRTDLQDRRGVAEHCKHLLEKREVRLETRKDILPSDLLCGNVAVVDDSTTMGTRVSSATAGLGSRFYSLA